MAEKKPSWYVYILRCQDGSFYTGITNNLEKRLQQHNEGKASKYTRCRLPAKMIYHEKAKDRSEATKRELAIKKLTKKQKEKLLLS